MSDATVVVDRSPAPRPSAARGLLLAAERAVAVLLVVALAPLLALLALLVVRSSPGKVLVRERGSGRLRFRTVLDGATTHTHTQLRAVVGQEDETPLTRSGAWLRRTRLDRLASLLDVAAGRASLARLR